MLRIYEITGDYRKLHSEELHNLYYSQDTIKIITATRMRSERHITHIREKIAYWVMVQK
jgi:hypothetical protein